MTIKPKFDCLAAGRVHGIAFGYAPWLLLHDVEQAGCSRLFRLLQK
jgi:hypothetical protein